MSIPRNKKFNAGIYQTNPQIAVLQGSCHQGYACRFF